MELYDQLPIKVEARRCEYGAVTLRKMRPRDWKGYYEICSEPGLAEKVGSSGVVTPEQAKKVVNSAVAGYLTGYATRVAIDVAGRFAGCISVRMKCTESGLEVDLGYWLSGAYQRRGIMTGALREILGAIADIAGNKPVECTASVLEDNVGSQRVLERCGFKRVLSGDWKPKNYRGNGKVELYTMKLV